MGLSASKSQRFEFRQVTTHLRPPRLVVLVRDDLPYWRRICLSVLEWTTRVWGGRYVPIVPTDGSSVEEVFWSLLETFDPDYIYAYQPEGRDVEDYDAELFSQHIDRIINQQTENGEELTSQDRARLKKEMRRFRFDRFEISEALRSNIKERLNPFHRDTNVVNVVSGRNSSISHPLTDIADIVTPEDCQDTVLYDFSALSSEMQLLVSSIAGRASELLIEGLNELNAGVEEQPVDPSGFDRVVEGAWEGERNSTLPHTLTNLHCSPAYRTSINRYEEPAVVVFGSSLQDYCLYQCLFSVKGHVYWMPESMLGLNTEDEERKRAKMRLRWHLANEVCSPLSAFQQPRGSQVRLISWSHGPDELEEVGQQIRSDIMISSSQAEFSESLDTSECIDDLLKYRREVFEIGNVDRRSVMQFDGGVSVDGVDTPKPKQFSEVLARDHRWITDLQIENYHLPPLAEFGPNTLDIRWYETDYVRATLRGFSYVCPHHTHLGGQTLDQILPRPIIRLQTPLNLFQTIFGRAGYNVRLSDKGDFQSQAHFRVGGFGKLCDMLRQDRVRQLLDLYVETEESAPQGEVVYLTSVGRSYISFRGVKEVAGGGEAAADFIDELVEIGLVRRGLVLQCQFCRNADWYDIANLSQHFTCGRCHQQQRIQHRHWKSPFEGPQWYFELDEIIYQFYRHNTHVTTLTLGVLKEDALSFIYVPELELHSDESPEDIKAEIDICAIVDGELIIGEASIAANKTRSDIDAYVDLANELGVETIVFSTLADTWNQDLVDYGTEQCQEVGRTAEFLTQENLLGVGRA